MWSAKKRELMDVHIGHNVDIERTYRKQCRGKNLFYLLHNCCCTSLTFDTDEGKINAHPNFFI